MTAREQNLQTVVRFFSPETRMVGGNKLRASLFHPNGVKECAYPITRQYPIEPLTVWAQDFLNEAPDVSVGFDLDAIIWATTDPNIIIAQTEERGSPVVCGENRQFKGRTYHVFKLVDGMIYMWKNFFNHFSMYDALGIPYTKLDRPPIMDMKWVEAWQKERDPMLVLNEVEPVVVDGMTTRIKVYGEVDESIEGVFQRKRNEEYIIECHQRANYYENKGEFMVDMYTDAGCTVVPFAHQAPTDFPNVFNEKYLGSVWPATANKYLFKDITAMYSTGDPNVIWIESIGRPISGKSRYWNHYIFIFRFDKGKIVDRYEIYDPSYERDIIKCTNDPRLPEEAFDFLRAL